jgi:hypothetical protein
MKTFLLPLMLLILPVQLLSQLGVSRDIEFTLYRVEQALRTGSPSAIEDLVESGITMRLGDSLYQEISSITAMHLLKSYFADKDSIEFRFMLPGTGCMYYSSAGRRDTVNVDVFLFGRRQNVVIRAINISNYPTATMFFNLPPQMRKKH